MPVDVLLGGTLVFLDFLSKTCSLQPGADLTVGHRATQVRASQSNCSFSLQPGRCQADLKNKPGQCHVPVTGKNPFSGGPDVTSQPAGM